MALLEGAAEGVNVVNLLASQWGEMFSNVGDFDGRTTFGARDFGGDGEFLVRVGTENRMQVLGHISLLGYSGQMIHPLGSGGPAESAIGDPLEVTMAEWAERCIRQGGLVVLPHAPNPQAERVADVVLGLVHAIEMMTFNPYNAQVNPYGLADWYRFQNLGYQIPLVAGSDKMAASSLLGGIRTYAHLGERDFTYEHWMEAVRAGNTFVTVGPLIEFSVAGQPAGSRVDLPAGGGTIDVTWTVASVNVPIAQIEVIAGGLVVEQVNTDEPLSASGSASLKITDSTWVALRVRGSYYGREGDIAAHTSSVQIVVGEQTALRRRPTPWPCWNRSRAPSPMSIRSPRAPRRNATSSSAPHWRALTTGFINGCISRASFTSTLRCMGMTGRGSTESWHSDDRPCLRSGCEQREGGCRAVRRAASARSGDPPLPQRSRARRPVACTGTFCGCCTRSSRGSPRLATPGWGRSRVSPSTPGGATSDCSIAMGS